VKHTITIDKSSLEAKDEDYQATITVTSPNAYNNPQKVKVQLKIEKEPPPKIEVTPESLSFSAKEGSTNLSSKTITIKNSGEGTLNYKISDDASWFEVSPQSGTSQGRTNSHTVSVNISGLSEGSYSGTITISDPNASNNPQTVNVILNITQQSNKPAIWVNTNSLSFEATAGGQDPSSKTLRIKNSGDGTLNYEITWDSSWLNASPSSGTSTGDENRHTVSVDISGLNEGTYNETITIADSNASNNPQKVNVSLVLTSQPSNNEISISCSPSSGGTGTIVSIPVTISGNQKEIKVFGLELTFDSSMFEFQSVSKGSLTGDWAAVDGNETQSGIIKIGGFAGSGSTIAIGSSGTIAVVKLKVICSSCSNGRQSQLNINNYADDIAGMTPELATTKFTYTK